MHLFLDPVPSALRVLGVGGRGPPHQHGERRQSPAATCPPSVYPCLELSFLPPSSTCARVGGSCAWEWRFKIKLEPLFLGTTPSWRVRPVSKARVPRPWRTHPRSTHTHTCPHTRIPHACTPTRAYTRALASICTHPQTHTHMRAH